MKWPWRRELPLPPSDEAVDAQHQAGRALSDAKALDRRIDRVAAEAEELRRVNHIAIAVARSLRGV